jgi:hypothetical protein
MIIALDIDEDGGAVPPIMSEVITTRDKQLDRFRTKADKDTLFATLCPWRSSSSWINHYCLQNTGRQALFLLYKSSYVINSAWKKLERAIISPARQLSQLVKGYQNVDFDQ